MKHKVRLQHRRGVIKTPSSLQSSTVHNSISSGFRQEQLFFFHFCIKMPSGEIKAGSYQDRFSLHRLGTLKKQNKKKQVLLKVICISLVSLRQEAADF